MAHCLEPYRPMRLIDPKTRAVNGGQAIAATNSSQARPVARSATAANVEKYSTAPRRSFGVGHAAISGSLSRNPAFQCALPSR